VPIGYVSQGVFVDDIYTDFSSGGLKETGSPLDIAITGSGFFCVSKTDSDGQSTEQYTRDGSFTLGPDGLLMTKDGSSVLGANGAIHIPNGNLAVDETGRIYANGTFVDTLKLTDFTDTHGLRKQADNQFSATDSAQQADFSGTIQPGFLEDSNVSVVREMVDMVRVSRLYDTNQRMIQVHDTMLNHAVNDIGRKV
jgi:flagellar basal-body rod protein FlgG